MNTNLTPERIKDLADLWDIPEADVVKAAARMASTLRIAHAPATPQVADATRPRRFSGVSADQRDRQNRPYNRVNTWIG